MFTMKIYVDCFNKDMMRITIHVWRDDTRTIWDHLE